jgi:hypothetical protein
MFAILIDNILLGFWTNQPGDVFIANTIDKLELDATKVKLIYFNKLKKPDFFRFNIDNSITIEEKIVTIDPDTLVEIISYADVKTIEGQVYYENGTALTAC